MDSKFFERNRIHLFDLMQDKSIGIVLAEQSHTGTMPTVFTQKGEFYYLTGLKIPNAILLLCKKKEKKSTLIFIERNDPKMEVWIGKKMSPEEAKELSAIDNVYFLDDFARILHQCIMDTETCYFDFPSYPIDRVASEELLVLSKIQLHYPTITIKKIQPLIASLSAQKSPEEIANIKKAIEITHAGIRNIWEHARPGMMEYELEAYFSFECIRKGERQMAFPPIIASGINATILHYEKNIARIGETDLVLLDVGAKYNKYSADISRTFPISGEFTERQKQVYNEVLEVQQEMIEYIRPGCTIKQLQQKAVELITDALFRLNLITKKEEYKKYYMHKVSHHLGLAAHDICNMDDPLTPNSVITVEPGIYIKEENIGIRIEDDVLITKNGCENLSAIIPKKVDEIEKIIANSRK
jgi:Xaa-Pro aminopeptidase